MGTRGWWIDSSILLGYVELLEQHCNCSKKGSLGYFENERIITMSDGRPQRPHSLIHFNKPLFHRFGWRWRLRTQ